MSSCRTYTDRLNPFHQVGHSLGGALSELDALFLTLHLDPSIHIKGVTFGTPRVGNPAWATLFDDKVDYNSQTQYSNGRLIYPLLLQ